MSIDLRARIATALQAFNTDKLSASCIELLDALGYRSGRRLALSPNTSANFERTFSGARTLSHEQARVDEWTEANFLLQLTDDEVAQTEQLYMLRERDGWNSGIYRSFAFIAIGLTDERYSRTALATIARAVNRLFMMPTPIFFRYGDKLTLAIILRRPGKRDASQDVLEKVTLIKDIDLHHPHAAHIRILEELALVNLRQGQHVGTFDELQSAWARTLDISELNKRFYQELANWHYWAVDTVTFPPGDSRDDEETRNAVAVIRLITRLIFVWFIKEKGLVPDALFARDKLVTTLHDLNDDSDSYYKAILQNLFFATLNTEMNTARKPQNRIFHSAEEFQGRNRHFGVPNAYRYARMFAIDQPAALALFATIPFLNGGLFECLDRSNQGIRIDGFSDRADNPVHVPNVLFFGNARPLDLNEVFGTRNKQYRVRGIFDIFRRYKFTIEENTPIDEDVALDPELLGKVFENLLAAYNPETRTTARKQTGSFYTPREIVDYMVDEALIAYLATAMRQQAALTTKTDSYLEARLRHLFAYTDEPHRFTADEVIALIEAIDRIKILDPACGSGAFPMGVLHKLVFILRKLDPNNVRWKQQQLERVQRDRLLAEQIEDEKNRERAIKEIDERIHDIEHSFAEQEHELDYTRKLYLIENCIYGVDIQPIAVQIAKLRFFISLVADQQVDDQQPNRGVRALPNLETKFVAANTLIGLPRSGQMMLRNPEIDRLEADLRRVRQRHFTARTAATKTKYREEDARLRARIGDLLQQDGWPMDTTQALANWNPYDQNAHAEFFDPEWMFGIINGFDAVLGNPPYLRVQGIQQTQADYVSYYRDHYQSAQGSFDLYALFIERGYHLLSEQGQFAYIVPHKFFQANFGDALRRMLTKRGALRQIVRFGSAQVFDEVTTYTCLLFLSAKPNKEFDLLEVRTLDRRDDILRVARNRIEHPDYTFDRLPQPAIGDNRLDWDFTVGDDNRVFRRIQQHLHTLGDITEKIFVGLQTSADKIYVLEVRQELHDTFLCYSKHMDAEIEIERGLVKPFLMGKDVHRYEPIRARNVVIFPYEIRTGKAELMPQGHIQRHYPLGWRFLEHNREALGDREKGRMHGDQFYAYIYPKNLTGFEITKIMTPDICGKPEMSIDLSGEIYHTTTLYSFVFKPNLKKDIKFLLGLLNSKMLWYYLSMTGSVLRGNYLRFKTEYLKPFPIADSTPDQERAIATLVDYVLYLKAEPKPSEMRAAADLRVTGSFFEQLIDALVYEMYFPEEFMSAEKRPSQLLAAAQLPALEELSGDKTEALQTLFSRIYNPSHPVRAMVFFLDSLETIRIVEAKSK
jgi:hypothetical protein